MNKTLSLPSSKIFDNSNLVDNIRQSYLDLEAKANESEANEKDYLNDISKFLQESQEFLENELDINTSKELFSTISLCFANFLKSSLPYFDLFFKKSRQNSNYIIVTASILYEISNNQSQLSDEYNKFTNDVLDEILPQIQRNNQTWTIFNHKILPQFQDDLLINLLLTKKITKEIFFDFFRFILPRNLNSTSQKYDLLIQIIAISDFIQIISLTKTANDEIFEFLTNRNFDTFSRMSFESFLLVTMAVIFIHNQDDTIISNLTKDSALQFFSIVSVILQKVEKTIELNSIELIELMTENIKSIQKVDNEPVNQISLKILIDSLLNVEKYRIGIPYVTSLHFMVSIIEKYIQNKELFQSDLKSILRFVFFISNVSFTEVQRCFDKNQIFNFIMSNLNEINKFPLFEFTTLNLSLIKKEKIIQYLNGLQAPNEIIQAVSFISKCFDTVHRNVISEQFNSFLMSILNDQIKEKKWENLLTICHFLKKYSINESLLPNHINYLLKNEIPTNAEMNVDEILEMYSLSDNSNMNGEYFDHLFTIMMKDKNIRRNYIDYAITFNTNEDYNVNGLSTIASEYIDSFKDDLIESIKFHFYFNGTYFLRKLNYTLTTLPVSEFGLSIIDKLFKLIEKKPSNFQLILCLKSIACSFPFLFNDYIMKVIEIVLPIFDYITLPFENKNIENQTELVKSSLCSISLLFSSLSAEFALDKFVTWLFNNVLNLSNQQVSCLMIVLGSLYNDGLFHCVIPAYVIKYNFAEIIGKLLERDIQNETFREFYRCSIYSVIARVYNALNDLRHYEIVQIIEFTKMENSFNYMYDYIYLTFPCLISMNNWEVIHEIFNYPCFRKFTDFINEIDEVQNHWQYKINYIDTLKKMSSENFIYFTQKLNELKIDKISKKSIVFNFPKLTTKMVRYLVMNRGFVYCWYLYGFKTSLTQQLANELTNAGQILTQLEKEAKENPDDKDNDDVLNLDIDGYLLPCYSQKSLFDNLVKQIVQSSSNFSFSSICDAIKSICLKKSGLCLLVETLSKFIIEFDGSETIQTLNGMNKIVDFLLFLSSLENFESVFVDSKCCDNLLNLILSINLRNNSSLLSKTANLFNVFTKNNLPIRVTHLIGFLFNDSNKETFSVIMQLCSKFECNQLKNIDQMIMNLFDSEIKKNKATDKLYLILTNYKGFSERRKNQIIDFINIQFDQFFKEEEENDEDELEIKNKLCIIGTLFNAIAPKRGNIQRIEKNISDVESIPNYIKETSPEFWNLFSNYSIYIMSYIQKHPILLNYFSFLLEFPEFVDFGTRSYYFRIKMKKRINTESSLSLYINRKDILETSFDEIKEIKTNDLMNTIQVDFIGEPVQDIGGGRREWFDLLIKEIFKSTNNLFVCSKESHNYQPNPLSSSIPNYLNYFKFAGKIVARVLIEGQCVDCHLTKSFYKQILHIEPDLEDLEDFDPELYKSLKWMLNNDVTPLYKVFAIENEEHQIIPLKENGEEIEVDNENKNDYVRLHSIYIMKKQIEKQLNAFIEGFNSLINKDAIDFFDAEEFDLLLCGITKIDVNDFKENTIFEHPYTKDTPVIKMFFKVISKWSNEDLSKLLMFITGSSRIPVNGFSEFCEMSQHPLKIDSGGDNTLLPQAHTCFNLLHLPQYETEEEMDMKLHQAIQFCDTFGLN